MATAGASVQQSQQVSLPEAPGTYWFVVTVNANGAVQEGPNGGNDPAVHLYKKLGLTPTVI